MESNFLYSLVNNRLRHYFDIKKSFTIFDITKDIRDLYPNDTIHHYDIKSLALDLLNNDDFSFQFNVDSKTIQKDDGTTVTAKLYIPKDAKVELDKNVPYSTRYTYMIFPTAKDKGYGCFAIKRLSSNRYAVAASFCNPNDRVSFSKAKAKKIAEARLSSTEWANMIENYQNSYKDICIAYMKKLGILPKWVLKSLKDGLYVHTLTEDCLKSSELIKWIKSKDNFSKLIDHDNVRE